MSLSRIPGGSGQMVAAVVKQLEAKRNLTLSGLKASTSGALERATDRKSGPPVPTRTHSLESTGSGSANLASIATKRYQPIGAPPPPTATAIATATARLTSATKPALAPKPAPTLPLVQALKAAIEKKENKNQQTSYTSKATNASSSTTPYGATSRTTGTGTTETLYATIDHSKKGIKQNKQDTSSVKRSSSSSVEMESESGSVSSENNNSKEKTSLSSKVQVLAQKGKHLKRRLGNRLKRVFSRDGASASSTNGKVDNKDNKGNKLQKDLDKFDNKRRAASTLQTKGLQARNEYWDAKTESQEAKQKKRQAKKEFTVQSRKLQAQKRKIRRHELKMEMKSQLGRYSK